MWGPGLGLGWGYVPGTLQFRDLPGEWNPDVWQGANKHGSIISSPLHWDSSTSHCVGPCHPYIVPSLPVSCFLFLPLSPSLHLWIDKALWDFTPLSKRKSVFLLLHLPLHPTLIWAVLESVGPLFTQLLRQTLMMDSWGRQDMTLAKNLGSRTRDPAFETWFQKEFVSGPSKLMNFSMPQLPHLQNEDTSNIYLLSC